MRKTWKTMADMTGKTAMKATVLTLSAAALLVMVGCQDVPRGSGGGRLDDSYQTTTSDRYSTKASIPALLEFSDKTAAKLAQEISDDPEIKARYDEVAKKQTRLVLEMGSIDNRTRTPSSDFELIQHRLRSQLMSSKLIRSKFMFVESKARAERDAQRIHNGTGGNNQTNQYANKDTYILLGDFYEANRGNRRQYFFNFKLQNAQTREIMFDSTYDLGQMTAH